MYESSEMDTKMVDEDTELDTATVDAGPVLGGVPVRQLSL
jgi:hypothetical protein